MIIITAAKINTKLIILPLFKNEKAPKEFHVPELAAVDFKADLASAEILYSDHTRLLLVGLGERAKFGPANWRVAIQSAISSAQNLHSADASLVLPRMPKLTPEQFLELTAFAIIFSGYQFTGYKKDKQEKGLQTIELILANNSAKIKQAIARGIIIGVAANQARSLGNHPGNAITPSHLAKHAQELAAQYKFTCRILSPKEIEKENMGLLTGVSKGSEEPACFIVLEYGPKSKDPIVLIGKGLTFDSGGISIKPADRMEEMKYDMCGAADVLGIFEAASQLKLPHHLVGLIPSTENLVSGKATKPGDVLISKSGVSVEVINTDAEGRLVLADAIDYAKAHYKPRLMIDYATLTGAVLYALGDMYTGYFSNTKQYDKLFEQAGVAVAEYSWPLPMPDEYKDHVKSPIADIQNVGAKGLAGATAGALFLEHFVGKTPWIHLDIAGTAWTMRPKPHAAMGATAWGVYLTVQFLRSLKS